MDKLIDETLKCVEKEKKIMDRMFSCEEEGNYSQFNELKPYYKMLKDKTDSLIDELVTKFNYGDVVSRLMTRSMDKSQSHDQTVNELLLVGYILAQFTLNGVFIEEHHKDAYSMYLWHLDDVELTPKLRRYLHENMKPHVYASQFIRYYYSGDEERAERICNPDERLGIVANDMAFKFYYPLLNRSVDEANTNGIFDMEACMAKKIVIESEIAAICSQMKKRGIFYNKIEVPISKNAEDAMRNATQLSDRYEKRERNKKYEKVIYL